jgi:hypothetical protein
MNLIDETWCGNIVYQSVVNQPLLLHLCLEKFALFKKKKKKKKIQICLLNDVLQSYIIYYFKKSVIIL